MFRIIRKIFIILLTYLINSSSIVNVSNHSKYVSLSNPKCKIQPALINLQKKKIDIKNRPCYYFDDIIKIKDLDFDNI